MPDVRILIVDDFQDFRRFISSLLQQRPGFRVIGEASDGLEALEKARELQPDLILLDIGLPYLNGMVVARRLPKAAPAAKILFLSSESDPDVAQEALRLGEGYVHKLRAQIDLLSAIDSVLRGERFISSGLDIRGGTDDFSYRHEVVFCSDDKVLVDTLAPFIAAALRAGGAAIGLVTHLHRDSLLQKLTALRVNVDAAIQQGTFIPWEVRDALSTFMVNDWPDEGRFSTVLNELIERAATSTVGERRRVVTCGECAPTLWADGKVEAAIRVEDLWNENGKIFGTETLCVYPALPYDSNNNSLKRLCAEHSAISHR